jgi:hypothetical protein
VELPAGVPHALACGRSEPVRYLDVHAPNFGFGTLDERPAP